MATKNITIAGFILNQNTKKGIANLKVEAWDRDNRKDDLVGSSVTGSNGQFSIILQKKKKGWNLTDRKPDIYFKVYFGERLLQNTIDSVIWNLEQDKKDIEILIDMEPILTNQTGNKKTNIVFGKITDKQSRPLSNLLLRVFDRDMRSEVLMAETVTDKEGKYEINWQHKQLTGRNRKEADISISVLTPVKKTLLFTSDIETIRFNASPREEINITISTAIKPEVVEYDYILKEVTFLAGDVTIADLQENEQHRDLSFLSRETDIPEEKIGHLVVAHRLQGESKIDAAFFYALLRKNSLLKNDFAKSFHARLVIDINTEILPLLYDAALADTNTVQLDIKTAFKELIIPARVSKECKQNIEQLQRYIQKAEDYYKNEHPQKVINLISRFVSEDKFTAMGKLFEENKNDINTFFKKISDESFFSSKAKAADAKTSLLMGEFLGFDNLIIDQIKIARQISKPEEVKKLAALNKADWKAELIKSADKINIAGKPIDKDLIDFHASSLARKFEKQFPTVAFSAQLAREKKTIFRNQESINMFFSKHEDFDLQHSNIDLFLKEKNLNSKENEAMGEELKTMQRVFKLVPHYSKTNALLKKNIRSAQNIAAKGETRFVNEIAPKAGISTKEAKDIFRKAQHINTAAMLIAGELQDTIRGRNIPALEMKSLSKKLEAVSKDFPNLKSLFNLTDTCACEHCRSVYSPAAYLVEILEFLKNRSVVDLTLKAPLPPEIRPSVNEAKNVLFERRPDLGEIDLSCENANTPVPYIDLVCELLEETIDNFMELDPAIIFKKEIFENSANKTGKASKELIEALQIAKIPVTNEAMIYATETDSGLKEPYYLRDKKAVCKIEINEDGNYIVKRLRQTLSTADELAAAPEYVNQEVYKLLSNELAATDTSKRCDYAFKLPFDLYHTEAKAYFNRFGISRDALMKEFQTLTGPTAQEIAGEKLGLTNAERLLIITPDVGNQQKYWNAPPKWNAPIGEIPETTNGDVLKYMKRVDHFLDKTRLTYKELELLLSLKFISQEYKFYIHHNFDDPLAENPTISCDTAKKDIPNLDEITLDRIHRFLRLQKKTGWKFEVLDEIIMQAKLGKTKLDDACLIKAADLVKLAERTGIKLDELIGFYGEIPYKILNDDAPKPLYYQVFFNKAKNGFIDDGMLPDKVSANEAAIQKKPLLDYKTTIAICLQITELDFLKLLDSFAGATTSRGKDYYKLMQSLAGKNLSTNLIYDDLLNALAKSDQTVKQEYDAIITWLRTAKLSFANLSKVYFISKLMKKLKLNADDFLMLTELANINIYDSPENALSFLDTFSDSKQFPLNSSELKFFLRHEAANLTEREIKDDTINKILEELQKEYQDNFTANKSPFDINLTTDEQKETLQNALSKLSGLTEEDVKIFIQFIDNDWKLPDEVKTFINSKLKAIFTIPQITAINNSADALESAPGPIYDTEKSALVNVLCQTIDPTIDLSVLSEVQKINKLRDLLKGFADVSRSEVNSLISYIELGNEKRIVDDRLSQLFNTILIKTAINELDIAFLLMVQATSDNEDALLVLNNTHTILSAASNPADVAIAQAQVALAETQLEITLTALKVANENYEKKRKDLVKAFLEGIADYQTHLGKQLILEQTISTTFKADIELVKIVLKYAQLKQPSPGTEVIADLLMTDALIDKINTIPIITGITQLEFIKQFQSLRLLHKLFPLVSSFKLMNRDIEWYFKHNHDLGWFEWDNIPYEPGLTPSGFSSFIPFLEIIELSKQLTPLPNPADVEHPITFFTIAEMLLPESGITKDKFIEAFSLLTGYNKEDLNAIDSYLFTSFNLSNYRDLKTWKRISQCAEDLRKLGSTVTPVKEYIKPILTSDDTISLRTALKARYDEDTWLATLKEIMDAIRPQKRDALVAYLLATNPEMKDENYLYDYFLVDVEMESCMPSSRIVQAHNSIQLFVQRCLIGLEPKAAADVNNDKSWEQWQWMKNYRVWEADRKIFLYPENWIESELRDDKSYLFTELENELQQNELTEFSAEEALIKYLEKLDNIAFLEIVATWYQEEIRTMHVFGRTKGGNPTIYYYRKFEKEQYWTPWEKVELDISGDQLLAFVRNNRLCLAWPVFSEEPHPEPVAKIPKFKLKQATDNEQSIESTDDNFHLETPSRKLKIQLAISEFADKKWQPKKISKEEIKTPDFYTKDDLLRDKFNMLYFELGHQIQQIWFFNTDTKGFTLKGIFNISGCKGYPELFQGTIPNKKDFLPDFLNTNLSSQRYNELDDNSIDILAVKNGVSFINYMGLLRTTPGKFRLTYPLQFSKIDIVAFLIQYLFSCATGNRLFKIPFGTLLPYFMEDTNHAYVIIPGFFKIEYENETEIHGINKSRGSDVLQLIDDTLAKIKEDKLKSTQEKAKGLDEYIQIIKNELNGFKYGEEFKNMYHPLICALRKIQYRNGVSELMKRETQLQSTDFSFKFNYGPNEALVPKTYPLTYKVHDPLTYPVEDIDFTSDGSYSAYNWELFFHVPLLIATRLTKNQRFEEALTWFHYMFNPTGALEGNAPQKYWVTKPFYLTQSGEYVNQRIDKLLYNLSSLDPKDEEFKKLKFAIDQWREKPSNPHVIARFRSVSYQKTLLMKYIDNLTEWGDYLFRQDTMESIAQATQMYILADKLLGPKPSIIPPAIKTPYETYNQVESKLDAFGNALIGLENMLPDLSALPDNGNELPSPMVSLSMLYFCVPQNDKMLEYWDCIADRLFKIRHCQNIDGIERSLALFAPPIDPGMLVRAAAAGLDIQSILAGINAPTPYYRFNVLSQKTTELAQELRGLGNSLLQALEKKDAEEMSLLRSELEINLLNAVKDLKLHQINEAKEQIETLKRTKAVTEARSAYYSKIEKYSVGELLSLDLQKLAHNKQQSAQMINIEASLLGYLPSVRLGVEGFGGSAHATMEVGTQNIISALQAMAASENSIASMFTFEASKTSTLASYERRWADWKLQEKLANKELIQIDQQIVAAKIRKEIAETDLRNHELQIENANKTNEFMHSKYTNKELYEWMIGQISSVYFKAYQLAHDFAKKAERCYRFELGNDDSFISTSYWDSMKKGLQSADHLIHDIKRMETSYLDKNKREYELTKHVSLSILDPLVMVRLKATGVCDFEVPEALFDMDHAGHYFRRIKSVSISLPCIAGPYTSVSAKLSLVKNKYRKNVNPNNLATTGYVEDPGNDERFIYNIGAIQSIAASNSQNDSGVFELNFRDERYLPFEGTGAISSWRLELPKKDLSQFNYDTISDVIVHMKYTAREGGSVLRTTAEGALTAQLNAIKQELKQYGLHVAINMKHDLPNEWHLLNQNKSVDLIINKSRLTYITQFLNANIESVIFIAKSPTNPGPIIIDTIPADHAKSPNDTINLAEISGWDEMWRGQNNSIKLDALFKLTIDQLPKELLLVVKYGFTV